MADRPVRDKKAPPRLIGFVLAPRSKSKSKSKSTLETKTDEQMRESEQKNEPTTELVESAQVNTETWINSLPIETDDAMVNESSLNTIGNTARTHPREEIVPQTNKSTPEFNQSAADKINDSPIVEEPGQPSGTNASNTMDDGNNGTKIQKDAKIDPKPNGDSGSGSSSSNSEESEGSEDVATIKQVPNENENVVPVKQVPKLSISLKNRTKKRKHTMPKNGLISDEEDEEEGGERLTSKTLLIIIL